DGGIQALIRQGIAAAAGIEFLPGRNVVGATDGLKIVPVPLLHWARIGGKARGRNMIGDVKSGGQRKAVGLVFLGRINGSNGVNDPARKPPEFENVGADLGGSGLEGFAEAAEERGFGGAGAGAGCGELL